MGTDGCPGVGVTVCHVISATEYKPYCVSYEAKEGLMSPFLGFKFFGAALIGCERWVCMCVLLREDNTTVHT